MIEFWNTVMGRQLIDGTLPELVRQLRRIANSMEGAPAKPDRLNDLHQWAMGYIGDNESLLDQVDDLGYAVGIAAACDWLLGLDSVLTEEVDRLIEENPPS